MRIRKRLLAAIFISACTACCQIGLQAFAQEQPAQNPEKPGVANPVVVIDDKPVTALPYTPSLDMASMDRSADPCVDFYQFTCGGWMKNNPIPPDQARWSVYGKVADENRQFLWGILEEAASGGASRTPVQQKIGDYFASCMDEAAAEKRGADPLQPELDRIAALRNADDVSALLPALHLATASGGLMFGFGSSQDFGDATQVIAFVDAGGLGL